VLSSPENFEEEWLNGSLKLTASGPDESEPAETIEISVGGKMGRRIAVYGSQIDEKGVIDLGLLYAGQGARIPLTLRVRDTDPEINVREIRARPDFVKVQVTPYVDSTGVAKPGLYHLDIEVPPDAPACHHLGVHIGQVVVEFDHPRVKSVAIKLSFAVKEQSP